MTQYSKPTCCGPHLNQHASECLESKKTIFADLVEMIGQIVDPKFRLPRDMRAAIREEVPGYFTDNGVNS